MDFKEKIVKFVAPIALATGASAPENGDVDPDKFEAFQALTDTIFNDEETKGFKQHILREADEYLTMQIVIHSDNTVTFESASGKSKTRYISLSSLDYYKNS